MIRGARFTITNEGLQQLLLLPAGVYVLHIENSMDTRQFEVLVLDHGETLPKIQEGSRFPKISPHVLVEKDENGHTVSQEWRFTVDTYQ